MICKKCGVKNKDTSTKCFNCGASLKKSSSKAKKVEIKEAPKEFYIDEVAPNEKIEILPEVENIEEVTPIEETPVEVSEEPAVEVVEETTTKEVETAEETESSKETATEEAVVGEQILISEPEEEKTIETENFTEEEKTDTEDSPKKSKNKILLWTLISVAVILLIVAGLFVFKDKLFNNSTSDDAITALNIKAPEITAGTDENSESYINAKFYGKAGDVLKLKCNDKSYTFTSDSLELELYLKDLFNQDYIFTENTVTVDLNASYTRKKEYTCKTTPVQLSVPDAVTDLDTTPKQIINSDSLYNLSFWVEDGSKVTVDNEEVIPDVFGIINYQLSAPEENTTYKVTVTQPFKRQAVKTISFIKNEVPFNFTVASDISDIHSQSTVTATYTVDTGAEIRSNLPVVSLTATEVPNTYSVTFDISACEYGNIDLSLTAKTEDASVKKTISFKYWPEKSVLEASAIPFDTELLTSPLYDKNIIFNNVVFTEVTDAYKIKGNINGTNVIFSIYGIIDEIELNTPYNVIAQMEETEGSDSPVFKIWYALDPTISDDMLDEAVTTE